MVGDGFKSRIACPNYQGEDCAPDASAAYCFTIDEDFFIELVGALNQWCSGDGIDAVLIHKLNRLTKKANEYLWHP